MVKELSSGHRRNQIITLLSQTACLFHARYRVPLIKKYPNLLTDPFDALCYFLEGFAFERQGASPNYRSTAADIVMTSKSIHNGKIAKMVWGKFIEANHGKGVNPNVNPLYHQSANRIKNCKCVWCALKGSNIVAHTKESLENGETEKIFIYLTSIRGIGHKIASLFMLDISTCYAIKVELSRQLLQPIDLWVRRAVCRLAGNPNLKDKDVADWIVNNCKQPEVANQGFWYFGSQISRSEWVFNRCLDDLDYASRLLDYHLTGLVKAAEVGKKSVAPMLRAHLGK
jgi:hypothetical protein